MIEILEPIILKSKARRPRSLTPGETVELPDKVVKQLFQQAKGMVRIFRPDWQAVWREVAEITEGIADDDPRFQPINALIDHMDGDFLKNDWAAFQDHLNRLKNLLSPGQGEPE